jgi:hypothetical protein
MRGESCAFQLPQKMQTQQLSSSDYQIFTEALYRFGGNFCANFADLIRAADQTNRAKLIAAFPELVEKYGPDSNFAKFILSEKQAN